MNPTPFYNHQNFINVVYAVDLTLMEHFSDLLLKGDKSRTIYASNAYALRRRSDMNDGNLDFPFINFRLRGYTAGEILRWNARAKMGGVYIPELGGKVIYSPIGLQYEATMWLQRTDDTMLAIDEAFYDADNKTLLKVPVSVAGQELDLAAWLAHEGPNLTTDYQEEDWLERNHVQTIELDIEVQTFALRGNFDVAITEEVLFNFVAHHSDIENPSYEEAYKFFVDHVNETVS